MLLGTKRDAAHGGSSIAGTRRTDTFTGVLRFGAIPSNEGVLSNVEQKRRSP